MPRFFFDVYDGRAAMRDEVGVELEGVQDAYDEAASLLPEFARESIPDGQSRDFGAAVRDDEGKLVYRAVLLFRGDTSPPDRPAYNVKISGVTFDLVHSVTLREEARILKERLTANVTGLLALLEGVSANVAAIRKAREDRAGKGE